MKWKKGKLGVKIVSKPKKIPFNNILMTHELVGDHHYSRNNHALNSLVHIKCMCGANNTIQLIYVVWILKNTNQ